MGTPSRIMKIPKFFTAFGILCIVGSINAQSYGPTTTEPPGEEPVPIPPSYGTYGPPETIVTIPPSDEPCHTPDACLRHFGGKKGICVNMKELDITTIGRYYNRKEPGVLGPCKGSYQSDCCRCLKNKCKQSRHCHKGWSLQDRETRRTVNRSPWLQGQEGVPLLQEQYSCIVCDCNILIISIGYKI